MDWSTVKHFKPEEWGKDPEKVHPLLVHIIDEIREVSGIPISIHVAYDYGGHSSKSYHYRDPALAVDFDFKSNLPLSEQVLYILEYEEVNGIGAYPYWNRPGFHIDLRPAPKLYWIRTPKGVYNYYTKASEFLKALDRT